MSQRRQLRIISPGRCSKAEWMYTLRWIRCESVPRKWEQTSANNLELLGIPSKENTEGGKTKCSRKQPITSYNVLRAEKSLKVRVDRMLKYTEEWSPLYLKIYTQVLSCVNSVWWLKQCDQRPHNRREAHSALKPGVPLSFFICKMHMCLHLRVVRSKNGSRHSELCLAWSNHLNIC